MRAFATTALASLVLTACGGDPVYDRPDATLAWPSERPSYAVPDGGMGYVSNSLSDQISFLDLGADRTMANSVVGIDPIAIDGPHHLALDPSRSRMYVALSYPPAMVAAGPHGAHGGSAAPGFVQMLSMTNLREIARAQIDSNPGEIVISPDHTRLLVTHFDLRRATEAVGNDAGVEAGYARLIVLDATDLHRIAAFPLCTAPHGVAMSDDGRLAYAACYGDDAMAIVHMDRLDDIANRVERIPVGPSPGAPGHLTYGPYAVLVTHDQQHVLVSDTDGANGRDIRIFDVAAHAFVPEGPTSSIRLRSPVYFGAESPDGRYFFYPTQAPDQIVRIRRSDWGIDQVAAFSRGECPKPHEIGVGPDGRYYVVCEGEWSTGAAGRVVVIDPMTLAITARFEVGVYPDRIVFATRGGS